MKRADRTAVRDAVVAVLRAQVLAVGGRIYRSRVWPMTTQPGVLPVQMPALLVYATPEVKRRSHTLASVDKLYRTSCDVVVIARATPPPGEGAPEVRLEALLEDLAATIEGAVLTAPTLMGGEGAVEDCEEVRTEIAMDPEAGQIVGHAVLVFSLVWSEAWSVPLPDTCDDPVVALAPAFPS